MADNGLIKILLLEPNDASIEGLQQFYTKVFSGLGYKSDISTVKQQGGIDVLDRLVWDVFITDLLLGHEDINDGLTVVRKVKSDHPELIVIANSRGNISLAQASIRGPSYDMFVHKTKMADPRYLKSLQDELRLLLTRNVHLCDDTFETESNTALSTKDRVEALDFLRTITFTSHSVDHSTVVNYVRLTSINSGRSNSKVYRVEAFTKQRLQCINAVLKISAVRDAQREIENYNNYVRWYLPYTWRPELIGCAMRRDKGAICYSFVYNDDRPFYPLTEYIQRGEWPIVQSVVGEVFAPTRQRWYHSANVREESNLTDYYYRTWFIDRSDPMPEFRRILRQYDLSKPDEIVVEKKTYPMPNTFLLGWQRMIYHSCICHGDLNGNNLFVGDNKEIVFIDFQTTGRGHVFQDFIVMDGTLRWSYQSNVDLSELIKRERKFLDGHIDALPCGETSELIRQMAKKNMPMEKFSNYLYGIALFCYRSLRYNWLEHWQKEQLAACLLATLDKLRETERPDG